MKIVSIFEHVKGSLLSVKYLDHTKDVLPELFDNWTDVEYLNDFFTTHYSDLTSGFYEDQNPGITIEEAIQNTIDQAEELETRLYDIALGQDGAYYALQAIFKPLENKEQKLIRIPTLQQSKVTGFNRKAWLRIYAVRIGPNTFVVSGGAIKLTTTMDTREHLRIELNKLNITVNYLKDFDVLDENDYHLLEIESWL